MLAFTHSKERQFVPFIDILDEHEYFYISNLHCSFTNALYDLILVNVYMVELNHILSGDFHRRFLKLEQNYLTS